MPNYQKGKIYTIRCRNDDSLIYVGSTIQPLSVRWGEHKRKSCYDIKKILYQTVNGCWEDWYIELYENYPCISKEELHKREGEIIRTIGTLNKIVNGRSRKEYYKDNKENILKNRKENHKNNKAKMLEINKKSYQKNRQKRLEEMKTYRNDNKQHIAEYMRVWCEKHKEELLKKKKLKYDEGSIINCECGGHYHSTIKSRHLKTKKHQKYLSTLVEPSN